MIKKFKYFESNVDLSIDNFKDYFIDLIDLGGELEDWEKNKFTFFDEYRLGYILNKYKPLHYVEIKLPYSKYQQILSQCGFIILDSLPENTDISYIKMNHFSNQISRIEESLGVKLIYLKKFRIDYDMKINMIFGSNI